MLKFENHCLTQSLFVLSRDQKTSLEVTSPTDLWLSLWRPFRRELTNKDLAYWIQATFQTEDSTFPYSATLGFQHFPELCSLKFSHFDEGKYTTFRQIWFLVPPLSNVLGDLGEFHNFSKSRYPHGQNKINSDIYFTNVNFCDDDSADDSSYYLIINYFVDCLLIVETRKRLKPVPWDWEIFLFIWINSLSPKGLWTELSIFSEFIFIPLFSNIYEWCPCAKHSALELGAWPNCLRDPHSGNWPRLGCQIPRW